MFEQIDVEVEAAMCEVMPGLNAPRDAAEIVPESSELANMQESLWFEDRNGPPALSDTEMSKLDEVADDVEIQRLIAKWVIRRGNCQLSLFEHGGQSERPTNPCNLGGHVW